MKSVKKTIAKKTGPKPKFPTAEEIQFRLDYRHSILDRLARKGFTTATAASAIGRSHASVSGWLYGHSVSAPVEAALLELLKGKRR